MAFWDRVVRKRNDDEENDDLSIYKDEPHTGRFASVLFGLFALFVTLLIAGGLFFGGRAIYRAINDDSSTSETAGNKGSNTSTSSPASSSTSSKSQSSQSNKTQTSNSKPSSAASGGSMPSTGDNVTLPHTGDPGL